MAKKILTMEHSKYRFEYEEGKEYDFHVYRGSEDITRDVKNNVLCDLFYETLETKEKYATLVDETMEWCIKRREAVPFEDYILGRIKPLKKESKIVTFDEQMALYKEYEDFLKALPPENVYSSEELWRLFEEQRGEQEVDR